MIDGMKFNKSKQEILYLRWSNARDKINWERKEWKPVLQKESERSSIGVTSQEDKPHPGLCPGRLSHCAQHCCGFP